MGSGPSFPIVRLNTDRIIIVTGANTGLGYEIAKWSAMMGATVILACRCENRARRAMEQMIEDFATEKAKGTQGLTDDTLALEFMELDLGSFKSVVQFCENFIKSGRKLHVLFCNAGVGFGRFRKTDDGLEQVLQVNYLSHVVVVAKLLPIMKNSGDDCRILLMSSNSHKWCTFDLSTMNYSGPVDGYSSINYYGRSKLYQIMQMYCMTRRLRDSNITINSIHPGIVRTEIGRNTDMCIYKCVVSCIDRLMRSPIEGARCAIDCTVNPKLAGVSGHYYVDCKIEWPSRTARNEVNQELLWQETLKYVQKYLTHEEIAGIK